MGNNLINVYMEIESTYMDRCNILGTNNFSLYFSCSALT